MSVLTIVATPIGNIKDITLRALDEINQADLILAEDTRHSLVLIKALAINLKPHCRLVSCDSHKENSRINLVLEYLIAKKKVILLSDAGCPTISDPGSLLVQAVINAGFLVNIIPGPSAHSAALMGAGINTTRFAFLGFLPLKKSKSRELILESFKAGLALVIYEAPNRVLPLLDELYDLLGKQRVVIARELTKVFETFHRGFLGEKLTPAFVAKGECVVIVESNPHFSINSYDEKEVVFFIKNQLAQGSTIKDIVGMLVKQFNIKKNVAYDLAMAAKE
jgi:16S rRNA (cytidine1402-2'-O)-methyltransferase